MRHLKTLLTVLGAVTVLVLAGNTIALAATGHSLILGKSNSAKKITALSRTTTGTALKVHTKSSNDAPLAVNGHGKVANLNADLVDGIDSSALQTRSTLYRIPAETGVSDFELKFPNLPAGLYHISFYVFAQMSAAGAQINCHIETTNGSFFEVMAYGSTYSNFSTSNGSGLMDTRTSGRLFRCFTQGGTATVDPNPASKSQIVVTRIDGLGAGTLTTPRTRARSAAPGAR